MLFIKSLFCFAGYFNTKITLSAESFPVISSSILVVSIFQPSALHESFTKSSVHKWAVVSTNVPLSQWCMFI